MCFCKYLCRGGIRINPSVSFGGCRKSRLKFTPGDAAGGGGAAESSFNIGRLMGDNEVFLW